MTAETRTAIAFLGTGTLGSAMVLRLLSQGIAVTVWNRTAGKLKVLLDSGATAAATPRDAAAAASLVGLCLTDAAAVEEVVFGAGGIAQTDRSAGATPRLVIDFSTIGPHASRDFAARLARASGDRWLDSPVSGGVRGADTGTLILFCGGAAQDLARAGAVLQAVARRATHVGNVGAGQAVKLCNQLIVATTLLAIADAVALGRDCGVDVAALPATLADGFADSTLLRLFGPRMAARQIEPRTGTIGTMSKDVELISLMAEQAGVASPLLTAVRHIYREHCSSGHASDDLVALGPEMLR
jgi:3-hydroxyisobutyrate dehydrogenase/2-hydroxy-3-oxopropionate reductase